MRKLFILFFVFFTTLLYSQQFDPAFVKQQLEQKGISQQELEAKLKQKGVDLNNVTPANAPQTEKAVQDAIAEIEAEKKQNATPAAGTNPPGNAPAPAAGNNPPNPPPSPTQTPAGQQAIQQAVEQAQQNVQAKADNVIEQKAGDAAKTVTTDIKAAVQQGATVPEAITEQLLQASGQEPSTGMYGQELFRNKNIQIYRNADDIKAPDNYILGTGDKVTINIWGYSEFTGTYEIGKDGYIQPDKLPRIYLKGIEYGKAKKLLESRFNQFFQFGNGNFEATLSTARVITINITGEVFNFGSYSLPAINTAFNALVAAGGPTAIGSMRNIKIIRSGEQPKRLDIYEFLLDPTVAKNYFLQENDYIYVPVAERIVNISGSVHRPMKYELIKGENLFKLIEYAGGLEVDAYLQNIQVKRFQNDQEVIIDINLKDLKDRKQDFELLNGDVISIRKIPSSVEQFVNIDGEVYLPDRYSLIKGMRVKDLIEKGRLKKESRTDIAFLQRMNSDNTFLYKRINVDSVLANAGSEFNYELMPKDKIIIYSKSKFVDNYVFNVTGAVRNPGERPFDTNNSIRVADAIIMSGGLLQNAADTAYIRRSVLSNNKKTIYLKVNVKKALEEHGDSTNNIVLVQGDILQVYSNERFSDAFDVTISGAVRSPGNFAFDKSLKVSDVVYLSGGLQLNASDTAYIRRPDYTNSKKIDYIEFNIKNALQNPTSQDNIELKPGDAIQVYSTEGFTDVYSVSIGGMVRNPGDFTYEKTLHVSDLIYFANGLKPEAETFAYIERIDPQNHKLKEYVRVDLTQALTNLQSPENVLLKPGDKVQVFSRLAYTDQFTVRISGAVRNPGEFQYDESLTLQDLLTFANGLKLEASPSRIEVFRVLINKDQPSKIVVASIKVDPNFNITGGEENFKLQPFDQVVVRTVPEFQLQRNVTLKGELKYPGTYALLDKNEKVASLISRAGGLTTEAFPEGATLFRTEEGIGFVVMQLKKALKRRNSSENLIMKDGDVIEVPKQKDLVSIAGATRAQELYVDKLLKNGNIITVPYAGTVRRAYYYVTKYAAGVSSKGSKKLISVEYPNGEIKNSKNFWLFSVSPKVKKGSKITVGKEPPPPPDTTPPQQKTQIDWGKVLADSITQATAILSLILLIQRIN